MNNKYNFKNLLNYFVPLSLIYVFVLFSLVGFDILLLWLLLLLLLLVVLVLVFELTFDELLLLFSFDSSSGTSSLYFSNGLTFPGTYSFLDSYLFKSEDVTL